METLVVFFGWGCLALGVILAVPLLVLGSKVGYAIGTHIGRALGTFARNMIGDD